MGIRIRVYPQYQFDSYGSNWRRNRRRRNAGHWRFLHQDRMFAERLRHERRIADLQIGYERAIWGTRINQAVTQGLIGSMMPPPLPVFQTPMMPFSGNVIQQGPWGTFMASSW